MYNAVCENTARKILSDAITRKEVITVKYLKSRI